MNGAIEWNEFIGTVAAAFTVLGAMGAVIYWLSLRMMVQPAIKAESEALKSWCSKEFADSGSTRVELDGLRRELDDIKRRGGSRE